MATAGMTTLDRIRLLLGDKEVSDELLELYSEMATQRILNYINRSTMPEALVLDVFIPTVLSMATGNDGNTAHTIEVAPEVASVSEGGASVTFKTESANVAAAMLENQMFFYKDQLNRFRRLL